MHQNNVIYVIISIFWIKVKYERYVCNGCHNLMQKDIDFNDFVILSVKGNDYRIHFWYMSKDDAINIMKNSNLNEENWLL